MYRVISHYVANEEALPEPGFIVGWAYVDCISELIIDQSA
jgi:hypothetical protein